MAEGGLRRAKGPRGLMNQQRWQRIETLFNRLVDRPEPERRAILADLDEDPRVLPAVRAMLDADAGGAPGIAAAIRELAARLANADDA